MVLDQDLVRHLAEGGEVVVAFQGHYARFVDLGPQFRTAAAG